MTFEVLAGVTLITDSKVLAIPIHENQESWIDLRQQHLIALGPSPEVPDNQDYTFLRKAVYEQLMQAQNHLPKGLRFCLYEGYRSLGLQKKIFETHYNNIKQQHQNWAERDIFLETTKLVSPVINFDHTPNIPPHTTGAALDVYLIDEQGNPIDMEFILKIG